MRFLGVNGKLFPSVKLENKRRQMRLGAELPGE